MYKAEYRRITYGFHGDVHHTTTLAFVGIDKIYIRYYDLIKIPHIDCVKNMDSFKGNAAMMAFSTPGCTYVEDVVNVDKLPEFFIQLRDHAYACPKCNENIKLLDYKRNIGLNLMQPEQPPQPQPQPLPLFPPIPPSTFGFAPPVPVFGPNFGSEFVPAAYEPPSKRAKLGK